MQKSISRTIALRAWNLLSGFIIVALIPLFLTPNNQGLYYSFSSLLSMQIFFELGLGQVLLYKFAELSGKSIDNISSHLLNLHQLIYCSRIAYRLISFLFFFVALLSGFVFFNSIKDVSSSWRLPWLFLVFATSINLNQSVKLIFLEATGYMHHVSVAKLRANVVSTIVFAVVISSGGSLWSACSIPLAKAIYLSIWLYSHKNANPYRVTRSMSSVPFSALISIWKSDIFPMQWRISLSWISGYFIFQLYTPLALKNLGPIAAGQLGYTISIFTSLTFIATTFTTALAPNFSQLFSRGQVSSYNKLFDRSLLLSVVALIAMLLLVITSVYCLLLYFPNISNRFLSVRDTIIYGLIAVMTGVVNCLSIYLRSQQKEPLLQHALFTAALLVPALIISSQYSITTMLLTSLCLSLCSFAWAVIIYNQNRRHVSCYAYS